MRLKIDVYYDGSSDVEFMTESLTTFINKLTKDVEETKQEKTYLFPLGTVQVTNELNPVKDCECEDADLLPSNFI
jgi:hypothetical protein